jgi:cell division protein FtsB
MRNVRNKQLKNSRKRKQIVYITVSLLLFVYLSFIMIVGENGFLRYIKLKSERDKMLAENIVIQEQNGDMNASIEAYDSKPGKFEGLARDYGLTKEGELIFKFDNKE